MRDALPLLACVLLLGACGEEDTSTDDEAVVEAVQPEEATVPEGEEASAEAAATGDDGDEGATAEATATAGTGYSIHEWGLIDVDLSDSRAEYAAGPGRRPAHAPGGTRVDPAVRPIRTPGQLLDEVETLTGFPTGRPSGARRKPVLYFHLAEGASDLSVNVSVSLAPEGRVVEHFPAGDLSEHAVSWTDVGLSRGACEGGPYPRETDPICTNVADDYCEAAELAAYHASDADCLSVRGQRQAFLFYRGDGPMPALPLRIERGSDGTVTVHNESMATPVGELLRIRRGADGIRVAALAIPAMGSSIAVGRPSDEPGDTHRETLRRQLRAIGLSDGEAAAFEAAWFGELFDASASTPHALRDAVLYFLPAETVDGFAHIEATPAPSATVRAMAIRAGWARP